MKLKLREVEQTFQSGSQAPVRHSSLQCSLSPNRVVVGAPKEIKANNQTGGLYKCDYSRGTCKPIHLQGESLPLPGTQHQAPMLWDQRRAQESHWQA